MFPNASDAVTTTAGEIFTPGPVVAGCVVNASVAAAAGLIVSGTAGAERLPDVETSVYPELAAAIEIFVNVATPATAVTVVVPASVPPTGFAPNASVTLPTNAAARFPCASRARTTIGVSVAPAVAEL